MAASHNLSNPASPLRIIPCRTMIIFALFIFTEHLIPIVKRHTKQKCEYLLIVKGELWLGGLVFMLREPVCVLKRDVPLICFSRGMNKASNYVLVSQLSW